MVDESIRWDEDLLEHAVLLEKYKQLSLWVKLGVEVGLINKVTVRKNGSEEEALNELFTAKAIIHNELDQRLKDVNPYVWVRVRNTDTGESKVSLMKYKKYVKLITDLVVQYPDIHWWPVNFEKVEDYFEYVVRTVNMINERNGLAA